MIGVRLFLAICYAASPAFGLIVEDVSNQLSQGKKILWLRDCGTLEDPKGCSIPRSRFWEGDADQVNHKLAQRYEEVWLWSGGGDSDEGMRVGRVLRRYQATVRVRRGTYCVSACSVAFLGGFFRFIEDGANYEVHAPSRFRESIDDRSDSGFTKRLAVEPEQELRRFVVKEFQEQRSWAAVRFRYVQQCLVPLGRTLPSSQVLDSWVARGGGAPPYLDSKELVADAARIRNEGKPAMQEVLLKLELRAKASAFEELRHLPGLGIRAEAALNMIETMISTRITSSAVLTPERLVSMGFVTRVVKQ